jgi:Ca-activated chloride channel family protein
VIVAVVRWVVRGALVALVAVSASPAGAVAATGQAPVIVVLDASGSMDDQLAGGDIKIDAARDAVHALVDQLPDGAQLGLAVYGNGARGCQDATVVHKVKPLDRSAVNAAVDEVRAAGDTPIGRALRVAAAELPAAGPRSIVLVSDGEDTCAPPDPCDVAKELAKQGIDLRIHAIGFDVDDTAKEQLTCLSQATGGTYVEARDAGTLSRTLNQITRDAAGSGGFWSNLTEKPLFWIGVSLLALLLAALVIVLIVRGRRATKPASGTPAWSRPGPPY